MGSRVVRLEQGLGIVSLLLSIIWAGEHLEVYVDTIDGRYLML